MTAPLQITVDVSGALERLKVLLSNAQDLTPVLQGPINTSLNDVFVKQFDSEGAAYGTKWRSLSPATIALRKRRGHGRGGILRDTNVLWASMTKLGLGPNAVRVVTARSLERGTTLKYGLYQQTGYLSKTFAVLTKRGDIVGLRRKKPKQIPARPFIPESLPSAVTDGWAKMIGDFITATKGK